MLWVVLLVLLAIVFGIGALIKGLLWLLLIAVVVAIAAVAGIVGALRRHGV